MNDYRPPTQANAESTLNELESLSQHPGWIQFQKWLQTQAGSIFQASVLESNPDKLLRNMGVAFQAQSAMQWLPQQILQLRAVLNSKKGSK